MKSFFNFTFSLSLTLFFSKNSYAYLDPGFASMIFQSILGFFALLISFIWVFFYKIKEMINKFIRGIKKINKK